jgi:hypothetical protein
MVGRVCPRHRHRGRPLNSVVRRHLIAVISLIGGFVGLLAFLALHARLLRLLNERHRSYFVSNLGAPTDEQLRGTPHSRAQSQLQWRFIRFRWSGEFLKLHDRDLNFVNFGLIAAESVTIICALIAFVEIRLK